MRIRSKHVLAIGTTIEVWLHGDLTRWTVENVEDDPQAIYDFRYGDDWEKEPPEANPSTHILVLKSLE